MRLRTLLFLALCVIALVPVLAMAAWDFHRAHQREIKIVEDTHLLLARNVGAALERYARDVRSTFELAARMALAGESTTRIHDLLIDLDFVHLCLADANDGTILRSVVPTQFDCPPRVPPERFEIFRQSATAGATAFTSVLPRPGGRPTLYLLRTIGDVLAIGAVDTRYIVDRGREIAFGKLGHAAIVDHTGKLLAHPLDRWIAEMRDLSGLEPVKRMLAGLTGTVTFFSPALKAEMVAGHTRVASTGWGVMIPQPLAEIEEDADRAALGAAGIGFAAVLVAATIAWFLSGLLTAPLAAVTRAARRMSTGEMEARVGSLEGIQPAEVRDLAAGFDAMARALETSSAELQQALSDAREAAAAKTTFLATVSHEIRTPLNGVLGTCEMLLSSRLDDRQREIGNTIRDSARSLLAIVSDVLDMSRIEAGRLSVSPATMAPRDLVDGIVTKMAPLASAKGIVLVATVDDDVPAGLVTDPLRLHQILLNLVDNGIKFTNEGRVRLSVHLRKDPIASDSVAFVVEDTGIGVAHDLLPTLFEPFVQADDSPTRAYGGTGLGLSISRGLATLLDGRLEASSTPGEGSVFQLTIPARLAEVAPGRKTAPLAKPSFGREPAAGAGFRPVPPETTTRDPARPPDGPPRVLVAEDHSTNRWLLHLQLESLGLVTELCEDGEAALSAFRAGRFDLVITDYLMPRMDGVHLTEAIRSDEAQAGVDGIPILGLTANAFDDALERCRQAGMTLVLTKPAPIEELQEAIETLLGRPVGGALDPTPPSAPTTREEPAEATASTEDTSRDAGDPGGGSSGTGDSDGSIADATTIFDTTSLDRLFADDLDGGTAWLLDFQSTIRLMRDEIADIRDASSLSSAAVGEVLHGLRSVSGGAGAQALHKEASRLHAALHEEGEIPSAQQAERLLDLIDATSRMLDRVLAERSGASPRDKG